MLETDFNGWLCWRVCGVIFFIITIVSLLLAYIKYDPYTNALRIADPVLPAAKCIRYGNEGYQVEVFYLGKWSLISYDSLSINNVNVLCRALGYQKGYAERIENKNAQNEIVSDMHSCTGTEIHFVQCNGSWALERDTSSTHILGLRCSGLFPANWNQYAVVPYQSQDGFCSSDSIALYNDRKSSSTPLISLFDNSIKHPPKLIWLSTRWQESIQEDTMHIISAVNDINKPLSALHIQFESNKDLCLSFWRRISSGTLLFHLNDNRHTYTADMSGWLYNNFTLLSGSISLSWIYFRDEINDKFADVNLGNLTVFDGKCIEPEIQFGVPHSSFTKMILYTFFASLLSLALVILVLGKCLVCFSNFSKEGNYFLPVKVVLKLWDFALDCATAWTLRFEPVFFYPSIVFVIVPVIVNIVFVAYTLHKENTKNTEKFQEHSEKYPTFLFVLMFFSFIHTNILELLYCEIFDHPLFKWELLDDTKSNLKSSGLINSTFEDLPQLIIKWIAIYNGHHTSMIIISAIFSSLTLSFTVMTQVYYRFLKSVQKNKNVEEKKEGKVQP